MKQPSGTKLTGAGQGTSWGSFWGARVSSTGGISLLLALVTLAVFWPVVGYDFINYDDSVYVYENAHVQGGLTLENVRWAFANLEAGFWHPLTWLSLLLDRECFGLRPGGYHLTSLLLHVANTLVLFLALRRMTGAMWRSAVVAALFALHPAHVESVAWVAERKDVLSTFFWMLALLMYARYAGESKVQGPKSKAGRATYPGRLASSGRSSLLQPLSSPFYLLALGCFVCGLMSKTMVITLPFVLLLLDYWPLRRFSRKGCARLAWEKLPFLVAAGLSSLPSMHGAKALGAFASTAQLEASARFQNAAISYVRYLGQTVWPDRLSILYLHPGQWPMWQVAAAVTLLAAISAAAAGLTRRCPYLGVGWFWFVGTLVPAIGLVQVGIHAMADRYTYVPLIGLFVMLVWGVSEAVPLARWRIRALAGGSVCLLAACAALTARQLGYWRDTETLFGRALQVAPENFVAQNILGGYYSGKGSYDEAILHYEASLKLKPDYADPRTHNNLGYALANQGRTEEAVRHYREAIRLMPTYPDPHNNLGILLASQGRLDEAIREFQEALRLEPGFVQASNNLAIARAQQLSLSR
jgi:protein O-mannosyl-transferase